jgi:tRNA 2-thiouridine synthesizing protein A
MAAAVPLDVLPDGARRLDCLGLLCPLPVIRLGRAMRQLEAGAVVVVEADDPGVERDIPDWCEANRQQLLSLTRSRSVFTARVRKVR